jgi:hypothetical protein
MAVLDDELLQSDIEKHRGEWVAIKHGHVLASASDPKEIVDWLKQHNQSADLIYRVPAEDEPTNWVY